MSNQAEVPWWVTVPSNVPSPPPPPRKRPVILGACAGGLLAAGVLVAWLVRRPEPAVPPAEGTLARASEAEKVPDAAVPSGALPETVPLPPPPTAATEPAPRLDLPSPPASAPAPAVRRRDNPTPAPASAGFRRRDPSTEEELRQQLARAPEIGLGGDGGTLAQAYVSQIQNCLALSTNAGLIDGSILLRTLPGAGTLPMHFGPQAQISGKAAVTLDRLSRKLRVYLSTAAPPGPDGHRPVPIALAGALRADKQGKRPEWLRDEAVPTLLQLLMHEDTPVRRLLVDLLAEIPGHAATLGLARRAVFDLDPGVRRRAVEALALRPAADYRSVLLEALRYPWPPPADHAAEALAALDDKEVVPVLVTLLKLPDPAAPWTLPHGGHVVREVVRANHLANCLLCHPPAVTGNEPVLGLDPTVTVSLGASSPQGGAVQRVRATPGSHSYAGGAGGGPQVQLPVLIRGDITFLHQDFSVQLPAALPPRPRGLPAATPAPLLRFDFVVRTRRLSKYEVALYPARPPEDYPQRGAVLFALRALTGLDLGPSTDAWLAKFPNAEREVAAARLTDKLVRAGPARLWQLLGQLRDVPDDIAVPALEEALPRLRGEGHEKGREVLAERLAHGEAEPPARHPSRGPAVPADGEKLFTATPLTAEGSFTEGIEGPACDAEGNVYAVNFARQQTIGRVSPDGKGEVWVTLPGKSTGNGIVFDRKGMMYVADYVGHNVLRIDPRTRKVSVFAHEDKMNQPNDLAIAPDGTLYASDPNWDKGTGQVWRIDPKGQVTLAAGGLGTTNGIEVSPDGKTLYVNESKQLNVWAFAIGKDGALSDKRLLKKFADHGFDGMRCDVDGNLYISRYGKGTVAVLSLEGKVLREIDVLGTSPSNLCFGGPDGRTVYVTEVTKRRLVQFRVDRPGLAWRRWRDK